MNIFTNDDYRRIQAWLKANALKDSDFAISEDTVPDEDILVITQNMSTVPTNYKIKIKNLLNSSLGKVVIDKITANIVKVNNSLTVDASKVILNNEKGTTLQDVLNYFEDNKLNRHTDNTFDGNLTVKKNITIEGNIKSHDDTITVEADLEATGEITDGQGNMLSDVNGASKGWKIEYQDPQQDEPTVRAKYVLKDYRGVPKGNVIKIYKDSAITNVYLGTVEDTCNLNTGEVTKHPIHNNNEALSIVYRLDTGKYSLVNVPIGIFISEAKFDKYKGLGVTENGQVFIKLASDVESSNYLHFNDMGEVSADGIENRILKDLGTIINSVANDGTMWGQYKKEEGTKDSPINEASRWGQYKQAESDRNELLNIVSSKVNQLEQEQTDIRTIADEGISKADSALWQIHEERQERAEKDEELRNLVNVEATARIGADAELLKRIIGKSIASSAYNDPFKYIGDFASEKDESGTVTKNAIRVMQDYLLDTLRHSDFRDSFPYIGHMRAHVEGVPIECWTYVKAWNQNSTNGVFVQVVRTNYALSAGAISFAPTEAFHEYFRAVTVAMADGLVTDVTATPWKESTLRDTDRQNIASIAFLGDFNNINEAAAQAATVQYAGNADYVLLRFRIGGKGGLILQNVNGNSTEQYLFNDGKRYVRYVDFTSADRTAVKKVQTWKLDGVAYIFYNPAKRIIYQRNQWDENISGGGPSTLPLASASYAGMLSTTMFNHLSNFNIYEHSVPTTTSVRLVFTNPITGTATNVTLAAVTSARAGVMTAELYNELRMATNGINALIARLAAAEARIAQLESQLTTK